MKEEEQEKEEKKKIRHELFLKNYRKEKKKHWTKESHTLPYNRLDTDDNLNINFKKVTEEEIDKEYNKRHPKLTKAEKARKAEDKWQEEFEARQSERRRATEEAEEYGDVYSSDEYGDDGLVYSDEYGEDRTRDFVAEWEADVAVRTDEITSAIADNTLKSISLADANNMDASTPHYSKTYPTRQYVLIGEARIWIGQNTVIKRDGEDITLNKINFMARGKGKGKGKKRIKQKQKQTKKRIKQKQKQTKKRIKQKRIKQKRIKQKQTKKRRNKRK